MSHWGALCASLLLALAVAATASGALLELRDGTRLEGRLVGATALTVQFETARGVRMVAVDDIASLRFAASAEPVAPARPAQAMPAAPQPAAPARSSAPAAAAPARTSAPAAAAPARTSVPAAAAPAQAAPTRVQLPAGTRLRVRVHDSIDPRQATEGDRFSALLEAPLVAGERPVAPARSIVYGVITAARHSGPASGRLQLELVELQIAGRPVAIVTGTQQRIEAPGTPAPASAATVGTAQLARGTLLEFRLLQPVELTLPAR